MRRRVTLPAVAATLLALLALLVSSCVSTDEVGGKFNPTPSTAPPPTEQGTLGVDVAGPSVSATVYAITPFEQSIQNVPRIKVSVRAENTSSAAQENPDLLLYCDESPHGGDWYEGSTWEPAGLLPVNAISQGEVIIGFPLKGDNPEYHVVSCTNPTVRMTITTSGSRERLVVNYPVEPEVITDALRAPRAPLLPLPLAGS